MYGKQTPYRREINHRLCAHSIFVLVIGFFLIGCVGLRHFDGSNILPANAYSIEKGADQISMRSKRIR